MSSTQTEQPEKKTINSSDLVAMEKLVNDYARIACVRHHINPEHFEVHLATELSGVMVLRPGAKVQIFLLWPHAQSHLNTHLRSAFSAMLKYNMRRTLEIVPIALVKQQQDEFKKFAKERFGEIGEILTELIPRQRLRVQHITTTILTDAQTGEQVVVSSRDKETRFDGDDVGTWLHLSRIVREKHPAASDVDENVSETPLLDETVTSAEFIARSEKSA